MTDIMDFLLPMLVLLIIGIIGVTFWVAWIIFKARYKKHPPASATHSAAVSPFDEAPRDVSLLALNHTLDGTWAITINGERYLALEAVPDDAVRQDVVAGLKELVTFARSYVQREQATKKQSQPTERQLEPRPVPHPESPRGPATPATSRVVLEPAPKVAPTAAPPTVQPAQDKLRVFLKDEPTLKRFDAAPTIMPTLDLAHEIGEIVSEMQARVPSLAQRSIRLQNAPSGGIQFAIDGIVYPGVNEIPDADIQALIRAATKEWERR